MERVAGPAADRVDHDVDPPEPIDRRGDHPIRVGLDGRVGDDREALRAGGPDPLDGRIERSLAATRHDHLRPGAREGLGDGGPDGAAAARDQGDAAVEAEDVELGHRCSFGGQAVRRSVRLARR